MNKNKIKEMIREIPLVNKIAKNYYNKKQHEALKKRIDDFLSKELPWQDEAPEKFNVGHEPTIRCNLRCKMCYQAQTRNLRLEELSPEQVLEVYKKLEEKLGGIKLVGGEPLVRQDIFDMISFWDERGVKVSLQSNCTMINENNIKEIARLKNIENVLVSVDGPEPIHDEIRGVPGTYQRLKKALELIRKHRPDIRITAFGMFLPDEDPQNLFSLIDAAKSLGFSAIEILFEQVYSQEEVDASKHICEQKLGWKSGEYRLNTQVRPGPFKKDLDIEEMKKLLQGVMDYGFKKKCFANFTPLNYFYNIERYFSHNPGRAFCYKLLNPELRIGPKGEVIWCDIIEKSFGSLLEQTPEEIWTSKELQEFRKFLRNGSLPICKRCCKAVYI